VATYDWKVFFTIDAVTGEMAIETSVALLTVKAVVLLTPEVGSTAEIVVPPTATAMARPLLPEVLEMVAAPVFVEAQVTELVMSWVLLSE
jgi:hypothetical protein